MIVLGRNSIQLFLAAGVTVFFCLFNFASADSHDSKSAGEIDNSTLDVIKDTLSKVTPAEPDRIAMSPIDGLIEVVYGADILYLSADGKYLLNGNIIELDTRRNLTEVSKRTGRKNLLEATDYQPVVFKADDERYLVTVFTDIDCPYCAKLHNEMSAYNELGISIQYLMFPRAGPGTASFEKAVSMWCAEDNRQAMTDAKQRKPIESLVCENPISQQYTLGQTIGVRGTPALITDTGEMIPGFVPPKKLFEILNGES